MPERAAQVIRTGRAKVQRDEAEHRSRAEQEQRDEAADAEPKNTCAEEREGDAEHDCAAAVRAEAVVRYEHEPEQHEDGEADAPEPASRDGRADEQRREQQRLELVAYSPEARVLRRAERRQRHPLRPLGKQHEMQQEHADDEREQASVGVAHTREQDPAP